MLWENLINYTINKNLYKFLNHENNFSDRLNLFLLHFSFFLKNYKNEENKIILQEIYHFNFRQLELSIPEIGYGDQSINKKMKDYLNLFYAMIDKIHKWDELTTESRGILLENFLDNDQNNDNLASYFEKYKINLINNTLNSHIKGVVNV